jgi:hypothetical protein
LLELPNIQEVHCWRETLHSFISLILV